MVNKIINKSKNFLLSPQTTILSAAAIIMIMIVASRVLGLVRQRALAHYFAPEELSLFFAAFRLPDLIFEVLVFGTFSSAFIPVFTRLASSDEKKAWHLASTIVNIGLLVFLIAGFVIFTFSYPLYKIFTPGFSVAEQIEVARLTRILFLAQGFFVVSYVVTGVLESSKRFLVPALSPIFYNIGIILGIVLFSERYGLSAPVFGVLFGSFLHLLIQIPMALKLGFRFRFSIDIDESVKKIGKLAAPRVIEVAFLQVSKMVELALASLVSVASYTFFTFGNTLQLLPVGLFGVSIAKAALPTLSSQAESGKLFKDTLFRTLHQMVFIMTPFAVVMIVLRIPIVRLVYGTEIFTWEATIQTGYVLSAFAAGIISQAVSALLARAFYALHDTRTPVTVSILCIILIIMLDLVFMKGLGLDVWGLAAAFSIGSIVQAIALYALIAKRVKFNLNRTALLPFVKYLFAAFSSGLVMYFILKVFDRSVWVKRLSFIVELDLLDKLNFESFVLDTRFTGNLLALTTVVTATGLIVYLGISYLLKTEELFTFINILKRVFIKRKIGPIPAKEPEQITPTAQDTSV
jgi:putative peptidoglycan lipid II flippase